MKKQGANNGATSAFLISTPESGVDSIAVTYALMDPIMTVIRPVAAFVTGLSAGVLENIASYTKQENVVTAANNCPVDNCCDGVGCPPEVHRNHHTLYEKIKAGLRFAVVDVWGDIVMWFFVGLLLAGVITALLPQELMADWFGGGLSSMLFMLVFGIPLYICATASTPIAAALILKGVSPGAALVFLLVGPATNITSLSVLTGILGRGGVIRYLMTLAVMAVLFGLGVDFLYGYLGISPAAIIGDASEAIPYSVKLASSLLLILLSLKPFLEFFRRIFRRKKKAPTYFSGFPQIHGGDQKSRAIMQAVSIHDRRKAGGDKE